MAKTEKELKELKDKVEGLNNELKELSEEELEQVAGGKYYPWTATSMDTKRPTIKKARKIIT